MKSIAFKFIIAFLLNGSLFSHSEQNWQLGPFIREDRANPILKPNKHSTFFCPIQEKIVRWECDHTFNPTAVVHEGKVFLLYRAEDNFGQGIGNHTSRLGIAVSYDGIRFSRDSKPVLYPDKDSESPLEWPGGCEDPRIVLREDGTFVMTYTQWTSFPNTPLLGIATSKDLFNWHKEGYAFAHSKLGFFHSKSGSIVCQQVGDKLEAVKINGKYWMYWGEGPVYAATSDNLIQWEPIFDQQGNLLPVLDKRAGKFDSELVEAGPPALLTKNGILLIYNGKNASEGGDPSIDTGAYSAGEVLFEASNPTKIKKRLENTFFKPERDYEKNGQYEKGTVFVEGLVPFRGKWFLYYGTADSAVGVAICEKSDF